MDISSLREPRSRSEMSVSELNSYIKRIFDNDNLLSRISVRGEISNFTYHRTGHIYFSLKDEESQIRAVMFRSFAEHLKFMPENGMKVIVHCSVGVYSQGGVYQLYVNSIQPDGIGALYLAYEQLRERLAREGIFDEAHKRPIPRYPEKIGVITSPTGAAVRDIINVTSRRYPMADIYLYPSLVQGDGAEENLIRALEYFRASRLVDVIIIGRGGGSIEDLWAFNSERLAYKIYETDIPIISAVGHETDFTICDFVSDMRAPTPSAAAELSVPDYKELSVRVDSAYGRIVNSLKRSAERCEERLNFISGKDIFKDSEALLRSKTEQLQKTSTECKDICTDILEKKSTELALVASKAHALSPLATLCRGYAFISSGSDIPVKSVEDVSSGDEISVAFSDGRVTARVMDKKRKTEEGSE